MDLIREIADDPLKGLAVMIVVMICGIIAAAGAWEGRNGGDK